MASSQTRQIQVNRAKPEDHVNDFLDFVSQFCAKKSYQGLRNLSWENEDLKSKLKQAEADCQDRRDALSDKTLELSRASKQLQQVQAGVSAIEDKATEWKRMFDESHSGRQVELKEIERLTKVEKAQDNIKEERDRAVAKHNIFQEHIKIKQEALLSSANEMKKLEESLKTLRSYGTNLPTHEDMQSNTSTSLRTITTASTKFAKNFLFQELDPSTFNSTWDIFRQNIDESHSIPLPASNSLAAKQMRIAAGLAVLATALQRQIFQPLYLGADSNEFAVFLESFREKDPSHELYLRSVLLKCHLEKQKEYGRTRAKNAAEEAMLMLRMLIPSDKLAECTAEITRLCDDALKQWMPLQHIKQQVVASMGFENPSKMGQTLDFPVGTQGQNASKANKQIVGSTNQASQAPSAPPEDDDSSSEDEDVYGVWPAFFAGKVLLQKGLFVTDQQLSTARKEIKMKQKAAKKKNRQSSESDTTNLTARRMSWVAFLGPKAGTIAEST